MGAADLVPSSGGDRAHPLAGLVSADESARIVRHYRFAVERMMRIMGGWIALTPELSAKLLLGRHVWDNAQHADALGKRLPELRAAAHVSEPASPAFAAFVAAVEEPSEPGRTVERLVGVYRVLKPHLAAAYAAHLERVNPVYEPPTARILLRMLEEERRHIAAGEAIIRHLASTDAIAQRAASWQAKLETLLHASGGVTGAGVPARREVPGRGAPPLLSDDAQELIRLERPLAQWPMPDALAAALDAFGDAVAAGNADAIAGWLGEGGREVAERLAALAGGRHRVVAFAKIGERRAVKIRVEAPAATVTLLTRWAPAGGGAWRAEAVDAVGVEPVRST